MSEYKVYDRVMLVFRCIPLLILDVFLLQVYIPITSLSARIALRLTFAHVL